MKTAASFVLASLSLRSEAQRTRKCTPRLFASCGLAGQLFWSAWMVSNQPTPYL